jgi:uncharacterized protein involved in copper resistance
MNVRLSMLTLPVAVGIALAQTTPPSKPAPQEKTQPADAKAGAMAGSASTALPEMKTTTFKGVLVDMSCASQASAGAAAPPSDQSANRSKSDSAASCAVSSNSSQLGMKLDDGKTVSFDLVGNQRAQDALKSDKRWIKTIGENKPIRATVSGVMTGDKLIVSSIH